MQKKEKLKVLLIITGTLFIALLINLLLSVDWCVIPTNLSKEAWLGFWASYITGIFAIVVGYYTIITTNKNSRRAIFQQNTILIRQKSDEIYNDIIEEIKQQVGLFNIVSFTANLISLNEDDVPHMKDDVLKRKSSIAERHLHWALIKNLYLTSKYVAPLADEYNEVWNNATEKLENFVKLELQLFSVIDEIKIIEKALPILEQLLNKLKDKRLSYGEDSETNDLISQYEKQRLENLQKQHEANNRYKEIVSQIHKDIDNLSTSQNEVLSASVKFLGQLQDYVFVRTSDMRESQEQP